MKISNLHEYQKKAANFIALHRNAILSVDMGLGKTAATLAFINWLAPSSLLIVAPKRVAENNWHTEAEKWELYDVADKMVVVAGTKVKRAAALADESRPYKIISRDNVSEVAGRYYDLLVIDELTSFKNVASKRTKAVMSILAARKVGLTGTFLANGAIDIFGQAAAVGLGFNGLNFYAWRACYFRDILKGSGLAFEKWQPAKPLAEILKPIESDVFTLTAEDYLTIPPVSHVKHDIKLSAENAKAYGELDAFLKFEIGESGVVTFDEAAKYQKLLQLCNGFVYAEDGEVIRSAKSDKLEAVADFVADCKEAGEPVLLFYAFREEAIWIKELLEERGIKSESVNNAGFLQRWNDGKIECLFAHPASAGHGLNLQFGGRVIVWSSLTYNYELYAQANARLARQGQTRNVQIHYFCTFYTCEAKVMQALQAKDSEQKEFLRLTKQ